jgi:hypothetical protein
MYFNLTNWLAETNKETFEKLEKKSDNLNKKVTNFTNKCETTYETRIKYDFNKCFDKQWQETMLELNFIGFTASGK